MAVEETEVQRLDRLIASAAKRSAREEKRFTNCYPALTSLEEREAALVEELDTAIDPDNTASHRALEEIAADLFLARGAMGEIRSHLESIRPEADQAEERLKRLQVRRAALGDGKTMD